MELLIWAGGRWRRVCFLTGRVAGWRRRAKFVARQMGELHEIPIAALAKLIRGPALPKQRYEKLKPKTKAPYSGQQQRYDRALPCKDVYVQTDTESLGVTAASGRLQNNEIETSQKTDTEDNLRLKLPASRNYRSISSEELEPSEQEKNDGSKTQQLVKDKISLSKDNDKLRKNTPVTTDTQSSEEDSQFNKLIIHTDDVLLFRRYIETHETDIDLYKFDADDNYKTLVFYQINPLVRIDRCPRISRMLTNRDAKAAIHFARQLGLRSVTDSDKLKRMKRDRAAKKRPYSTIDSENDIISKSKHRILREAKRSKSDIEDRREVRSREARERAKTVSIIRDVEDPREVRSRRAKERQSAQSTLDSEAHKKKVKERRTIELTTDSSGDVTDDEKPRKTRIRSEKEVTVITSSEDESAAVKSKTKNKAKPETVAVESDSETEEQTKNRKTAKHNSENDSDEQPSTNNDKRNRNVNQKPMARKEDDSSNEDFRKEGFIKLMTKTSSEKQSNENKKGPKNDSNEENLKPEKTNSLPLRQILMPKRSSVRPGRDYTPLEDQAIVAWLSAATTRERAVNGNRIWRELQLTYTSLTGQRRSWHSLRNRYLRYILPALSSLSLEPAHAQRLRAHAAIGELKARKQFRRNSVYNLPAVRSASNRARLARAVENGNSSSSENTKEISLRRQFLRSSGNRTKTRHTRSSTTLHASPTKSPTKSTNASKNTKASANAHALNAKSPSNANALNAKSANANALNAKSPSKAHALNAKSANANALNAKSPVLSLSRGSSPSYSELTRRFALRSRSTPHASPTPTVQHKRRLYNPQRLNSKNNSPA